MKSCLKCICCHNDVNIQQFCKEHGSLIRNLNSNLPRHRPSTPIVSNYVGSINNIKHYFVCQKVALQEKQMFF